MTPEELDRILSTDDPAPAPSPRFAPNVMAAVRRAADEPSRRRFPWLRFAVGATASLVMAGTGSVLLAQSPVATELASAIAATIVTFGLAAAPRILRRS
jgi:hypothetical protein